MFSRQRVSDKLEFWPNVLSIKTGNRGQIENIEVDSASMKFHDVKVLIITILLYPDGSLYIYLFQRMKSWPTRLCQCCLPITILVYYSTVPQCFITAFT